MLIDSNKKQRSDLQLGTHGELLVCRQLMVQGFTILARNYAVRGGEIDIIARKDDTVVFVEVKTRTQHHFNLSEVITPSKKRKIALTARHYIAYNAHLFGDVLYRFDVALVCLGSNQVVSYIKNAFYG